MDEVLSDYHNFGQTVTKHGKWFLKPRPTVWEHIFLDPRSELRKILCDFEIYSFLPNLHVDLEEKFFSSARMEAFEATDEFSLLDPKVWRSLGALQAFASYFGLADLHYENVLLGMEKGQFKIAPVDLECALNLNNEPWETLLLPSHITPKETCGYSVIFTGQSGWGFEMALLSMIQGFFDSVMHLDEISDHTNSIFAALMKHKTPICRVPLRSTSFYERIYANHHLKEARLNLLPSEIVQLERGDIPYYFRYPFDDRIFYFDKRESIKPAEDHPLLKKIRSKFGFWNQERSTLEPIQIERLLLKGSMAIAKTLYLLKGVSLKADFEQGQLRLGFDSSRLILRYRKLHGSCAI